MDKGLLHYASILGWERNVHSCMALLQHLRGPKFVNYDS